MKSAKLLETAYVVVVISTKNRPNLVLNRALPSVLSQQRKPDRIIVVEDQLLESLDQSLQEQIQNLDPEIEFLRNRRSPGLSGAINTALDQCSRRYEKATDRVFVAILDDDDAWAPEHLSACLQAQEQTGANFIASGLLRYEQPDAPARPQSIPANLNSRELFVRGQHIQGSNIFVRLDLLLDAGGYDEALTSCTDRDICLRLAAHPQTHFAATKHHTVHHYADPRPDRLSAPRSKEKLAGLTAFFLKHGPHFDEAACEEAETRARELFGWQPSELPASAPILEDEVIRYLGRARLLCGFITDAEIPKHACELLGDLLKLKENPDVDALQVLILENGPVPQGGRRTLHEEVFRFRNLGLDIELISIERQKVDWTAGRLVDTPDPAMARLPIAVTRTLLNQYLFDVARKVPEIMIWILDDDKRLRARVRTESGIEYFSTPNIQTLLLLKEQGVDAVIGPDTDAAPLPFSATVRMQLLDFYHFLTHALTKKPSDTYQPAPRTDCPLILNETNNYYDLARTTQHLETPSSLPVENWGESFEQIFTVLSERLSRVLAGETIFRPLTLPCHAFHPGEARPSLDRGGSFVVFNADDLANFPHTLARIGEEYVRRSDLITTALMVYLRGAKVVQHASAGVSHNRNHTTPKPPNDKTLRQDVLGYASARAMSELLRSRGVASSPQDQLAWSFKELHEAVRLTRKYVEERLAAITLSAYRIRGLCKTADFQLNQLQDTLRIRSDSPPTTSVRKLKNEIKNIGEYFAEDLMSKNREAVHAMVSPEKIRQMFQSMNGLIDEYQRICRSDSVGNDIQERSRYAWTRLEAHGVTARELTLLGAGGEGIVFTDKCHVYKVFDLLKHRPRHNTRAILEKLQKVNGSFKHFYQLEEVVELDGCLMVRYPFESSQPYTGGHGADMIGLLLECKQAGIVFRNMHPKNLRVPRSGLKLIDYGSDIRPFSESGFRSMAQRTWLSLKWHHRSDLDALMRKALVNQDFPELKGFETFWKVLISLPQSATQIVSETVVPLVPSGAPAKILDYGCGKKAHTAIHLATLGHQVVGYDPGNCMESGWNAMQPLPANLALTTHRDEALQRVPYDAVVCSLVLCELEKGTAYEQALSDLAAACRTDGLLLITVCNPLALGGKPTYLHYERQIPAGLSYEDSFWYRERGFTGKWRSEYHRSLDRLERDLRRHGLLVEHRLASQTIDLVSYEPASDFITLTCRKLNRTTSSQSVSLLIKTCAMELATLEHQVRHLLKQLDHPVPFRERILVIDSRRDGFLREYASGDYVALAKMAYRLQEIGLIDRIIQAPPKGVEAQRINQNWFGEDSDCTHSLIGAPLSAPLMAFDACTTPYLLQVDSDLLIHRAHPNADYLTPLIKALEDDPKAVAASLPIVSTRQRAFTCSRDGMPWRFEARGCLLHLPRLRQFRPFHNPPAGDCLALSWHRALDEVAAKGRVHSLRGSIPGLGFIHPPNELKENPAEWMLLLDLAENHPAPAFQYEQVELKGSCLDWLPPQRSERFVFVVTGRNTSHSKATLCIQSMLEQNHPDWGAIIIDDASTPENFATTRILADQLGTRATLIQPRHRLGQMRNITLAIRHICTNPDSVIVTLDLDDQLSGPNVLTRLAQEYDQSADCTIGSMLRTDKQVFYAVDLHHPRNTRGGNVWQHLRSFKKALFDAIPDQELRVGRDYVGIAVDWAFMLPIVEMAKKPLWIHDQLYLYEPSGLGKNSQRDMREAEISRIVSKRCRKRYSGTKKSRLILREEITQSEWVTEGGIMMIRHAHRPRLHDRPEAARHEVALTEEGKQKTSELASQIPTAAFICSPITSTRETAAILAAAQGGPQPVELNELLQFKGSSENHLAKLKERMGWNSVMIAWMNGWVTREALLPCHEVVGRAIRGLLAHIDVAKENRVLAVAHDFILMAVLSALFGERRTKIPYLSAVWIPMDEAHEFLCSESI